MDRVRIGPVKLSQDGKRVDGVIQVGDQQYPIYFQTQDAQLEPNIEVFLALALLPAMKRRIENIEAEGVVSQRFLEGTERFQQVFKSWKPNYGHVEFRNLQMQPRSRGQIGKKGVFFSGGLDSYYSFLAHFKEIAAFIHLDGFDIPLREQSMRKRMVENCRSIGDQFGKQAIILETNARHFIERYVTWSYSHGSVIGSAGLLLMPEFEKLYISGAGLPLDRDPFGSHPDLDPNWSTEILEFVHEAEVDKIDKCRLIGQFEVAIKTLHVCLRFPEKGLNCGECEKCLRSQVYLQVAGVAEDCTAFPKPLDLKLLGQLKVSHDPQKNLLYKALNLLEEQRRYPDTTRVLKSILYRPDWQNRLLLGSRTLRKKIVKQFKKSDL
jgi:hypothetical protein